jgi:predicted transcriptional regulator
MAAFQQHNRRASKLSIPEVMEIRELYRKGSVTQGQLSRQFGVSVIQIGRIVRGEVWQQMPTLDPIMSEGALKESAARMLALQEQLTAKRLSDAVAEANKGNTMVEELKRSPLDE